MGLDLAREILPGYRLPGERVKNHAYVGAAALKLRDALWREALHEGPGLHKPGALFLAGSPGSGKSAGMLGDEPTPFAVITEGMIGPVQASIERIQQAIDAGFTAVLYLIYVHDPKETLRRAVVRASKEGRPVTVATMARLWTSLPGNVEAIKNHFVRQLGLRVWDNSVHGRVAQPSDLAAAIASVKGYTASRTEEELRHELDRLRGADAITPELYAGFHG